METAKGVTNMALAHEIMVNQDFQIKPAELPEGRSGSECHKRLLLNSVVQIKGHLFCFFVSEQLGAPGEGDHAQSILGLLGNSAEGGSSIVRTRHQAPGRDQRGSLH